MRNFQINLADLRVYLTDLKAKLDLLIAIASSTQTHYQPYQIQLFIL